MYPCRQNLFDNATGLIWPIGYVSCEAALEKSNNDKSKQLSSARVEAIRDEEMKRTARRLADLTPAERDAVDQMTRAMIKKMLHEPWRFARAAGDDMEAAAALQSLAEVFRLEAPAGTEGMEAAEPSPAPKALGHLEGV